jgi:hypothetical protein
MFCRELAAQVRGVQEQILARGAQVVFIGNGTPAMAAGFARDFDIRAPLFTDPTLEAYRAAGLPRGLGSLLKTAKNAARTLAAGHRQGPTRGDTFQQGGVLVIGPAGDLRYRFSSETSGDHPPMAEVLAALP